MKIELIDIEKKKKNKEILSNINLEFCGGDIVGLIGPNGAGKSTLLKVVSNLLKPTSGEIMINKQKVESYYRNNNFLGILIDESSLYLHLTGYENLKIVALLKNISKKKIHKEILCSLDSVNLILDKTPVKRYSFGMKQRLAIAMAILGNNKIIILDEPTNGLDPTGIEDIRNLILKISNKNNIIIISSHMLEELQLVCSRFIFINKGEIKRIIKKEELKDNIKDFYKDIFNSRG